MKLAPELVALYFAITYCIGLIGLAWSFDKLHGHADRVQAVAVAAASPLVPPALALALGLLLLWLVSAPLRWLGNGLIQAGMYLLHPVQLSRKVNSLWKPSTL